MVVLMSMLCDPAIGQDKRAQYPSFLSNSYIGLQIGYIDYRFSNSQIQTSFTAASIRVPHLAVRVLLLGHDFNKYLSVQLSYMRPVQWVDYQNVNGDQSGHSVWMNVAGLTARSHLPLTRMLSIYGEGGLGIITRKGFEIDQKSVMTDANYGSLLLGGGLQYRVAGNWDLVMGATTSPENKGAHQPGTTFVSGGFHYNMHPLPPSQVERNSDTGQLFPKNTVQIGYSTDALGYSVNDFVSKGAVPIFWNADVRVAKGLSASFRHNVFHTRRIFALDLGIGVSSWKSKKDGAEFFTASAFPVLQFTALRTKPADLYFDYSLAGPSFISRTTIDDDQTGKRFTFQDFLAAGALFGHQKRLNLEIRIGHFSNGNLFPRNAGVTVPLTLSAGYVF